MSFLDAFNSWSLMHLLGSFVFTVAVGSLNLSLNPIASGSLVLGMGASWEVVADQTLRLNDRRGGDYYDVVWDFAGSALGTAMLEMSRTYRGRQASWDFGSKWARGPDGRLSDQGHQLGLNAIALERSFLLTPSWRLRTDLMATAHRRK